MGSRPLRVVVLEDESGPLEAVRRMLEASGHQVVGAFRGVTEFLASYPGLAPDLVIADIRLSGRESGPAAVHEALTFHPAAVVWSSGLHDANTVHEALAVAPGAYVVKPYTPAQLNAAISVALIRRSDHEEMEQLRGTLSQISGLVQRAPKVPAPPRLIPGLSPREQEILTEWSSNPDATAVADRLSLSPHTVRNHLKRVYAKLGMHTQAELMAVVRSYG